MSASSSQAYIRLSAAWPDFKTSLISKLSRSLHGTNHFEAYGAFSLEGLLVRAHLVCSSTALG